MTHEFNNQSSQAERKAIVKNDSYSLRQQNIVDDAGGRYAKLTPTNVIGSTSSPQYPQLPESSPWSSGFDQNLERPLGFSVDEMPALDVVGVEPISADSKGGTMAPDDVCLASSVETLVPPKPQRRKW